MKLAIADPPYFGRANRWYGTGRGSGQGRHRADSHPDAHVWDTEDAHCDLVTQLQAEYDGWAIAASSDAESLRLYANITPSDVRMMVWHRRNAPPSGSRVLQMWEPVYVKIPRARRGASKGMGVSDVLDAPAPRAGFAGAKPADWTRWVLAVLGYDPATDTVDDLFAGSGAVAAAADGMLA